MESNRDFKGLKKYENLLKTICRVDDYSDLNNAEWEGCLGMACVISVMEGIPAIRIELSTHLGVPSYNGSFQNAFERLRINGIFNKKQGLANDPLLNGTGSDSEWQAGFERERNAWCSIAGIAGGFIGIRVED
jgi:hypothetical protein